MATRGLEELVALHRDSKPVITLDQLKTGDTLDLGREITVRAMLDEDNRISVIWFSHPLQDGEKCLKAIPMRPKRKRFKGWKYLGGAIYDGYWDIRVDQDRTFSLSPSIACYQHGIHGYMKGGKWMTTFDYFLEQPTDVILKKLYKAEREAEEFGGGYQGAILALASRQRGY